MSPRFLLALLLPFAASGLQWLLWEAYIEPYVWFLFFPAAYFSAWIGGWRGGVASTLIGAVLVWFVFMPPGLSFTLANPASAFSIVVFIVMGMLFAWSFERLRRAREKTEMGFEATFQQAAVGIAMVAPDGSWRRVNRRLCGMLGYVEAELLSRTFQDITHPDDLHLDLEQVGRMLAREIDSYAMEKRYIRKDGRVVWANLTVSLVWKDDGQPDYFVSVVEDIQARKQAEDALRESEARLREAKRLAGLGHWYWDLRSGEHRWSEEIHRIYGRDPALPPAGYPEVCSYFTPESWARLSAAVAQCRTDGEPYACDAEVVRPDGGHVWIVARGEAVRDDAGALIALRGTVQDITRFVEVRRDSQRSMTRLRRLAEVVERIAQARSLAALMEVVRPAVRELTGADGATLVLREDGFCHYADEDAIGPLWKGRRFPLEQCISGWAMLNARPAVIEDIYADPRIPHAAYRPTFVKSLAMVPVGRDRPVAAIGCYWASRHLASDEELELQQALADAMSIGLANIDLYRNLEQKVAERTAELTAANRELDAFAYAVSHDLRAPLRAMNGFSQALTEDYGDILDATARGFLDQIGIASRKMGELIDGILTLSRGTRGELRRDRVDLSALATRHLEELARAEPGRRVEWEVEPGLAAWGDARMIDAVLGNLIGNAWKYTGRAAAPRIRCHRGEVAGLAGFCVADNGAGFDPAHGERLFKPFQRLHRQDEFPGIGIGLATAQRIVHRHGGEIVASGEPGRGATFCFSLPDDQGGPS